VYESIGAHERALEHARAAAVLTSADAAAEEVAGQLLLAPSQSVDGAVAPLREAAGRAAAEGAPDSAARYLRRALEEPIPDDERGALLLELAAVELNLGAATIIDRLQEAVRLVGDPERRAQARLELGRALLGGARGGRDRRPRASPGRARLRGRPATAAAGGDVRECDQAAVRYEGARRRLDSVEVRPAQGPGARMLLGLQAYHEASSGGSRERAIERAELALAAMSNEELAWNYVPVTYALLVADHLDEPVRYLDRLIAAARERGAVFNFAGLSMMRAVVHYARGGSERPRPTPTHARPLMSCPIGASGSRRTCTAGPRRSSSSAGLSTRPPSCSRPGSSSSPPTPTRSSERRYCVARRWC